MSTFFALKRAWEADRRADAVAGLERALRPWTVAPAFGDVGFLVESSHVGDFEGGVTNLLTATLPGSARPVLQVPFARAWAGAFALDPQPRWITLLLAYDFFQAPAAEGFDEQPYAPPSHRPVDHEVAIDVLVDAAREGVLVPAQPPRDGRPALSLDDLGQVDPARWGQLGPRLATSLAAAYARAPTAFWSHRLAHDPAWVAAWFGHDLIGRHGTAPASVAARWGAARRLQPAYADAGLAALAQVTDAEAFVTVELGRAGGRAYLDGWIASLRAGDGTPP